MGVLGTLFPLLWFLAFLSPIAAIFFAVPLLCYPSPPAA